MFKPMPRFAAIPKLHDTGFPIDEYDRFKQAAYSLVVSYQFSLNDESAFGPDYDIEMNYIDYMMGKINDFLEMYNHLPEPTISHWKELAREIVKKLSDMGCVSKKDLSDLSSMCDAFMDMIYEGKQYLEDMDYDDHY